MSNQFLTTHVSFCVTYDVAGDESESTYKCPVPFIQLRPPWSFRLDSSQLHTQTHYTTALWHPSLTTSFEHLDEPQFADAYYVPYATLLDNLFGIGGPFDTVWQFDKTPHIGADDVHMTLTVTFNGHPVLFIQVNAPSSLCVDSKQAHERMRDHFLDLRPNLATPRLLGISAFGTRMVFFEYTAATNTLIPPAIADHPKRPNRVASADGWSYDLLEADGVARMCQVFHDVRVMCGVASQCQGVVQSSRKLRLSLWEICLFSLVLIQLYALATGLISLFRPTTPDLHPAITVAPTVHSI